MWGIRRGHFAKAIHCHIDNTDEGKYEQAGRVATNPAAAPRPVVTPRSIGTARLQQSRSRRDAETARSIMKCITPSWHKRTAYRINFLIELSDMTISAGPVV